VDRQTSDKATTEDPVGIARHFPDPFSSTDRPSAHLGEPFGEQAPDPHTDDEIRHEIHLRGLYAKFISDFHFLGFHFKGGDVDKET
jgi:hypothetical protein